MQEPQVIAVRIDEALPTQAGVIADRRNEPIRLTQGAVALMVAPITVVATTLAACAILAAANLPMHTREMATGALMNTVGGLFAGFALWMMLNKGPAAIAQAGIIGIAFRCGTVLLGLALSCVGRFGFDHMILVYWAMAYYFPMLIVESALVAWLSNRSQDA